MYKIYINFEKKNILIVQKIIQIVIFQLSEKMSTPGFEP